MEYITKNDLWNLPFGSATKMLLNNYVYMYLEDNSIYQGIITAIRKADNVNPTTMDYLPVGLVINDEYVDITKIHHIEIVTNERKQ